ncbi:MAG: R3H domain-containing nucleic acid-binding protein [Candidatus Moranbacteria bacterium]|nr:R3H domain-containing nucleic acid-binding protein [Candidatus Moranbacteria bacterium]
MEKQPGNLDEIIKSSVAELLDKMGFSCEIEMSHETEEGEDGIVRENIICNIKTEESNFLIGQYGVNLQSLQHIARILIRKKTDERIHFIVDVNFYRKEKSFSIVTLAKNTAQQAVQEKRAIVLRPMSPYERRLVHMELSKNADVITESIGEGDDRKVVIKPAETV